MLHFNFSTSRSFCFVCLAFIEYTYDGIFSILLIISVLNIIFGNIHWWNWALEIDYRSFFSRKLILSTHEYWLFITRNNCQISKTKQKWVCINFFVVFYSLQIEKYNLYFAKLFVLRFFLLVLLLHIIIVAFGI